MWRPRTGVDTRVALAPSRRRRPLHAKGARICIVKCVYVSGLQPDGDNQAAHHPPPGRTLRPSNREPCTLTIRRGVAHALRGVRVNYVSTCQQGVERGRRRYSRAGKRWKAKDAMNAAKQCACIVRRRKVLQLHAACILAAKSAVCHTTLFHNHGEVRMRVLSILTAERQRYAGICAFVPLTRQLYDLLGVNPSVSDSELKK